MRDIRRFFSHFKKQKPVRGSNHHVSAAGGSDLIFIIYLQSVLCMVLTKVDLWRGCYYRAVVSIA